MTNVRKRSVNMADNTSKETQEAANKQNSGGEDNSSAASAKAGDGKYKVNPELQSSVVYVPGKNNGGDGEDGNEFYDYKSYDLKKTVASATGTSGLPLFVEA